MTDTSREAVERLPRYMVLGVVHYIREDSAGLLYRRSDVDPLIDALLARAETAEARLHEFQTAQGYRYIGRDMKPVLARDLEDRAEAAEAKLVKAVHALGEIATDEHPLGWTAIAALAEINGESHE